MASQDPRGKPTITDVARRAGVSKSLVSLVMRGARHVSPARRAAVLEAAAALSYRPNAMARGLKQQMTRILFLSCHSYLDPSSGAACSTRELLELLAAAGSDCRVLCAGVLDRHYETPLVSASNPMHVPTRWTQACLSQGGRTAVLDSMLNGIRVSILPTASSRIENAPNPIV